MFAHETPPSHTYYSVFKALHFCTLAAYAPLAVRKSASRISCNAHISRPCTFPPVYHPSLVAPVSQGRGNTIASMINKDLLSGLKLEMRAFGVYVPKNDHNEVKADDPVGTTKTSMDASPSPDDVVDDAGADASGEGAVESNANDVSAAATKAPEI